MTSKLAPVDVLALDASGSQPQRPIEEYDWGFHQRMLDCFVKRPFLLARGRCRTGSSSAGGGS